jgi:hypothetical protein
VTIVDILMDELEQFGDTVFVQRQPENYERFLNLYEEVGYAPADDQARTAWRKRSIDTWTKLDAHLPASYTGGGFDERVMNALGTLPMSPTIVYGHSFCMVKTLASAATMYPQTLSTLKWVERYASIEYWGGSYGYGSRFVVMFQRPRGHRIAGQIEIETLRSFPLPSRPPLATDVELDEVNVENECLLDEKHRALYRHLSASHPIMAGYHSTKKVTVRCTRTGRPLALVLLQSSLPELTAVDMFAAPWVFPVVENGLATDLYVRVRKIPALHDKRLEFVLVGQGPISAPLCGERVARYFWAFTPKSSIPTLYKSFRDAYASLLARSSDADLSAIRASLHCAAGV